MATKLEDIEKQAQNFSLQERAALIECLVNNLDELDEKEYERLWVEEAKMRYREYKAGRISSRSSEDVFQDARAKLKA